MFTQPATSKIASTYAGNPEPLARKVDQDKKQNGGIPKDLRQLMALNDIAEGKQAVGINQALQIPTNVPTVAQNMQQLAQKALQARLMSQAREQQRLQQKPPILPDGTPQPKDQPQGIDMLRANVGEEYAKGGIVAFDDGGGVTDQQIKDWFATNQGASDTDIYNAMQQYNVGTQQLTNAMGFDPTEVNRRYDVQARNDIFSPERPRAEQESMLNDFYQDKGLNTNQLGQTNFGYDTDTRESRLANAPYTNLYEDYQKDLAATGRYDAPEDAQFRTQAVYEPGALGSRGAIKLYDTATGQHLTNVDVGNQVQAFELLDKFGVDPRSYKQALGQSFGSAGVPDWQKDDYDYLMGYKPRLTANATAEYLAAPNLKQATVNDLRGRDMGGDPVQDRTLGLHMTEMIDALKSKSGMTNTTEATDLLHQFLPVQGLVNWSAIEKSKDPAKALVGTLNYLQTKGLINLDPNTGPLSQLNQYKPDSITTGRKLKYTGQEALRNLGLKGLASGGKVAHFDKGGRTSQAGDLLRSLIETIGGGIEKTAEYGKLKSERDEAVPGFFEALTPEERAERQKRAALLSTQLSQIGEAGGVKTPYPETGKPSYDRPVGQADFDREYRKMVRQTPGVMEAANAENKNTPAPKAQGNQGGTRVNTDAAPSPGIVAAPAVQTEAYKKLTDMMNQDPEAKAQALRDRYMKEVGQRDLSIYDKTAAELEARKQKLNAPKAGYDAMMEYLENIAMSGGRTSAEAGARGAVRQRQQRLEREGQQNLLMDKILELGAKKSEAQFAEKKGMFDMTQKERDDIFTKAFDAAKSVNASDDKAKELAAQAVQKELDRKAQIRAASIGAQDRDNLMSRAKALMAADPTKKMTLDQAMERAAAIAATGQISAAESRANTAADQTRAKIREKYAWVDMLPANDPTGIAMRRERDKALAAVGSGAGLPDAVTSAGGPTSSNVRSQADAIISGGR